jgi:cardiolipin synthase
VLSNRRVLDSVSGGPMLATAAVLAAFAAVALLWPAWVGWPLGAIAAWFALNLGIASWRKYRRHRRHGNPPSGAP